VKKYFARDALLPQGWARDVCIEVHDSGAISGVSFARKGENLACPVLPGLANLHSHAFQRAMAGLTEVRGPGQDDFWTWSELMYRFVERVTPRHAKAIATRRISKC
jgi:formimidoylglutamate deiminase